MYMYASCFHVIGVSFESLQQIYWNATFGMTDFAALIFWSSWLFFSALSTLFSIPRQLKYISKFVQLSLDIGKRYTDTGLVTENDLKHINKINGKRIIIKLTCSLLTAIINTVLYQKFAQLICQEYPETCPESNMKVITIIMFLIIPFFWMFIYPMSLSCVETTSQICIIFTTDSYKNWAKRFKKAHYESNQCKPQDESRTRMVQFYVNYGLDLIKMEEDMAEFLKRAFLWMFISCSLCATITGFEFLGTLLRIRRLFFSMFSSSILLLTFLSYSIAVSKTKKTNSLA